MKEVRTVCVLFCVFCQLCGFVSATLAAGLSSTGKASATVLLPKIVASAGETVLLPCNTTLRNEVPTVEWSKEGLTPNITFLYRQGCETYEGKNVVFQYRTNLIRRELHNGNLSLLISNVQTDDSGKYQCVIVQNKKRQIIATVELFVGSTSEPKLTIVSDVGGRLTLQCEAKCWFPEPVITLHDRQGKEISAEDPKTDSKPLPCLTVTRRVTLQTPTTRVTCRVHQPDLNKTMNTEIYIPDECLRSLTGIIGITVAVTLLLVLICAVIVFLVKKYSCSEGQKSSLDEKEQLINQLTNELNYLKSRQSQALLPSQPISGRKTSPGISRPVDPSPPKSPHRSNNNPKAANSADSSERSDTLLQAKDSKAPISEQKLAPIPRKKRSSHDSISFLSANNGAASSDPPSVSKDHLNFRSKSFSEYRSYTSGIQPQRSSSQRFSIYSNNPFNVLRNLPENSEDSEALMK